MSLGSSLLVARNVQTYSFWLDRYIWGLKHENLQTS
jgi:hypothetical protein